MGVVMAAILFSHALCNCADDAWFEKFNALVPTIMRSSGDWVANVVVWVNCHLDNGRLKRKGGAGASWLGARDLTQVLSASDPRPLFRSALLSYNLHSVAQLPRTQHLFTLSFPCHEYSISSHICTATIFGFCSDVEVAKLCGFFCSRLRFRS